MYSWLKQKELQFPTVFLNQRRRETAICYEEDLTDWYVFTLLGGRFILSQCAMFPGYFALSPSDLASELRRLDYPLKDTKTCLHSMLNR